LDGGLHNHTFTGQIVTVTKAVWITVPDGTVTVTVYLRNLAGAIGTDSRNLQKQTSSPSITIKEPFDDDEFSSEAPDYEIEASGLDEDSVIWYIINGDEKYIVENFIGTIDQDAWDALPDGQITIMFYVNNTWGNVEFDVVYIQKDTEEVPWWEEFWEVILGVIAAILALLGLGFLVRRYGIKNGYEFGRLQTP